MQFELRRNECFGIRKCKRKQSKANGELTMKASTATKSLLDTPFKRATDHLWLGTIIGNHQELRFRSNMSNGVVSQKGGREWGKGV